MYHFLCAIYQSLLLLSVYTIPIVAPGMCARLPIVSTSACHTSLTPSISLLDYMLRLHHVAPVYTNVRL